MGIWGKTESDDTAAGSLKHREGSIRISNEIIILFNLFILQTSNYNQNKYSNINFEVIHSIPGEQAAR